MAYWVKLKTGIQGPFAKAQLKALVDAGRVSEGTLVSQSEDGPWQRLSLKSAGYRDVPRAEEESVVASERDFSSPTKGEMYTEISKLMGTNDFSSAEKLIDQIEALSPTEEEQLDLRQLRDICYSQRKADHPPSSNEESNGDQNDDEDYSDEEYDYQEAEPVSMSSVDAESFTQRTRELGSEVSQTLNMNPEIPKEMRELFSTDEQLMYGSRPAQIVLIAQLAITAALAALTSIPMIFEDSFIGFLMLIGYGIVVYCNYLSWKNTVFAITSSHILARSGVFSRSIKIIPIKSVQMVDINTGMIDRWLGLNKVMFLTGATIPVPFIGLIGAVCFRHVDSTRVMKAFGAGA